MKVLHINQSDTGGGAAVAAVRLLDALESNGTDARMLVLEANNNHPNIEALVSGRRKKLVRNFKFLAEVLSFMPSEKNAQLRFAFSSGRYGYDLSKHPLIQDADILHLHWINQGLLSLKYLEKLIQTGKPIVWTLHDTWPFTGGCHYPEQCGGFTSTCGQCPMLKSPGENDLSARQHLSKETMYDNASLTFVGCSNWMKEMADKSSLVRKVLKYPVKKIFNPIDINLFVPGNTKLIREKLGLPVNKKLLLFGAANTTDPRKGTELLLRALKQISINNPHLQDELELVAFGKNIAAFEHETPFRLHPFNVVTSQQKMAQLYQASDFFVLPSMQDNLPNTVVESLSCGTPVVAFNIGGVPEMIRHNESGILVSPGKWKKLEEGILSLLDTSSEMGKNARLFAERNFAPSIIAKQYQEIYKTFI